MIDPRLEQELTAPERRDLHRLWRALSAGNPRPTRRDLAPLVGDRGRRRRHREPGHRRRGPAPRRSLRQDAPVVRRRRDHGAL